MVSRPNLKDSLKEKYGLTGLEVDDILRYMKALCTEFETLSRKYKTEYLIELKTHKEKVAQNKTEKNTFLKTAKMATNRVSSPAKDLRKQYDKTCKARDMLSASLSAHKIHGDHKRAITDILTLMSEARQLGDEERTITGRRAYESLHDAGIGN